MKNIFKYNIIIVGFLYIITFSSKKIYVVISSCTKNGKTKLNTKLLPYFSIVLKCNKTTNHQDSNEAGLMLDFIIKQYNDNNNNKYIFIHDHISSWHYKTSIYSRLKYLKSINYINKVDFSGIYCAYIVFGKKRGYDICFNRTYVVDKYMRKLGFTNLSLYQLYTEKYLFPCCSTFVVDNKRIKKYSKDFYIQLRKGIKHFVIHGGNNFLSGLYIEYMWSIIFGIKNIPIPPDCKYS